MIFHSKEVQLRDTKNRPKLPSVYFPGGTSKESSRTMSNQLRHHAIPIYSMIVYPDSKGMKALVVSQKAKPGFLSKEHHDSKIEVSSIRKYQYHRSKQDSTDKNYFPANNLSIQYSLRQYNQKR